MEYKWETAKRLEDLDFQRRKLGEPSTECEHEWEMLANTFITSGWTAYKQCKKCGIYVYRQDKK